MANNYIQATLTPNAQITDELRAVLEITGASLAPADNGECSVVWEDGINELDDCRAWDIPGSPDAAEAAAFLARWRGNDITDVLRAILAVNPGIGMLVIEGAYLCSKMRAGQFGGFGVYVTRAQSAFISSRDVVIRDGQLAVTTTIQDRATAEGPGTTQRGSGGILLAPAADQSARPAHSGDAVSFSYTAENAAGPLEAAAHAYDSPTDPQTMRPIATVTSPDGTREEIDLEAEDR